MVLSEIFLKIPYKIVWNTLKFFNKNKDIVFYCADYLDYVIFEEIRKHIPEITIVAKNKKVKKELELEGIDSILCPVFPKALIMARHAFHYFPEKQITKIGLRHGVYHFKKFISAKKYNRFDLYLFTSETEVEEAKALGITCGASGGFPKIDGMFKSDKEDINKQTRKELNFDNRPIVMFSATWDKSNASAIDRWYNRLDQLTEKYNVLVTLHPWVSEQFKNTIRNTKNVYLIDDKRTLKYLMLSDVFIGDTSSIIAEFCSLDKPIITFKVDDNNNRLDSSIVEMLKKISERIDTFDQLEYAIELSLKNPNKLSPERMKYNNIMFDKLDGFHGKKSAEKILSLLNIKN
jgi:CDP-glycerol glycerophosphotransferase (TagB/SpsB family)